MLPGARIHIRLNTRPVQPGSHGEYLAEAILSVDHFKQRISNPCGRTTHEQLLYFGGVIEIVLLRAFGAYRGLTNGRRIVNCSSWQLIITRPNELGSQVSLFPIAYCLLCGAVLRISSQFSLPTSTATR